MSDDATKSRHPFTPIEVNDLHIVLGFARRAARGQPHPRPATDYDEHITNVRAAMMRVGLWAAKP